MLCICVLKAIERLVCGNFMLRLRSAQAARLIMSTDGMFLAGVSTKLKFSKKFFLCGKFEAT